jgi:hypothetical protein
MLKLLREHTRWHWCGWGYDRSGWFPGVRAGLLEIWWFRPGARSEMRRLQDAERAANAFRDRVRAATQDLEGRR